MAYVLIIVPWGYDYLPYFCRHPYNLHKLCWQLLLTSITTTIANLTLLRARAQIFTPQLGPNPFWTGKVQIPMECHNQRAATKRDTAWIVGVFLYFPSVVPPILYIQCQSCPIQLCWEVNRGHLSVVQPFNNPIRSPDDISHSWLFTHQFLSNI